MYVKSATIALSLMAMNGASAFAPGEFFPVAFLSLSDISPLEDLYKVISIEDAHLYFSILVVNSACEKIQKYETNQQYNQSTS